MGKKLELVGQTFGKLTIISEAERDKRKDIFWLCKCECGKETTTRGVHLTKGLTKSCGCLIRELNVQKWTTHGESHRTPEWRAWQNMKARCTNPKIKQWKDYGGRGISVCPEWGDSYEAFLAYVGRKPSPQHSLDRFPNNDGNYEPGNVRWATTKEQVNNRRNALPLAA